MDLKRLPAGKTVLDALGLLALLATWFLGRGGGFLFAAGGIWILGGECWFRFFKDRSPSPYPWMLLSPLLLIHYASIADFRIRLACFIMIVYILVLARRQGALSGRIPLLRQAPWRIWLLSFLVFALAAAAFHARGIHLSGDEPHYIMMAQSLVDDGDLDLKNNLDDKTYFKYLPVEIPLHGMVHDGRYRSFHLPGVSFLLVPFVFGFNLLAGSIPANLYFRLAAALINAFFALGLFQLLKALWPEKDNGPLFLFFLGTFPLVFHAVHLFPELPAATLLIYAYLFSLHRQEKFLAAGLLLAAIPWFHFKYVIPMIVLELFVMARIWSRPAAGKEKIKNLAFLTIPQALGASLMAWYSKALYGSFNPTVISPEKNFFAIPPGAKIETLLSFFLDQRDGLLVYAPVFLLLWLVFKKEIRGKIRDFPLLAAIFLSYVLFHAYTTVRGGYSPAARPTVFVLWVMVVFLIAYYRQAGEIGRTMFRFLAGLGCLATVWIFYYPLFLYQPVTREVSERASSLLLFLGSRAVGLTNVFPSFLKKPNAAYLPDWVWLALLATGLVLYYSRVRWRAAAGPLHFVFPLMGLTLLFFLCFFPHVQLQTRYSVAGLSFYNNSRNFTLHRELGSFKILAGQDYDLYFDLDGCAADRLDMRLLNPHHIAWQVKNGRRTLRPENRGTGNRLQVPLRALSRFTLGKKRLVHVGLESKAGSGPGPVFFWLEFRR
jgi:hypothetical protein